MVTPRRLTEQELDTLYEEFKLHLWELICQENASPKHVVDSLLLMEEYEGYPFLIEWESDCPQVMSQWGDYGGPEITQEVTLTAHLILKKKSLMMPTLTYEISMEKERVTAIIGR